MPIKIYELPLVINLSLTKDLTVQITDDVYKMIERDHLDDINVIIKEKVQGYPENYYPPKIFPEFKDKIIFGDINPNNQIYTSIREILYELGLDKENFNTSKWNPMKDLISQGDKVVIKPNFVKHYSENKKGSLDEIITNPAILKPTKRLWKRVRSK